jgi:predicted site-specific integrase-resolvase
MKLSDYAKQMGVRDETAWRWYRDGNIQGRRVGPRPIISTEGQEAPSPGVTTPRQAAIYARVSSAENTSTLDSQVERLSASCVARGYQGAKVVKAVGSGINDARPKLLALLEEQSIGLIVVEHKDRLTRFGFRYLDTLLTAQGRTSEVVNQAENGTDDLLADLTAIVHSFCAVNADILFARIADRKLPPTWCSLSGYDTTVGDARGAVGSSRPSRFSRSRRSFMR